MVQARVAAGWSLRPTMRVVSWNSAKQTAQASGNRAAQAIAPAPGRTITRMPTKPTMTPSQSCSEVRSRSRGPDRATNQRRGERERRDLGQRQQGQASYHREARGHRQQAAKCLQRPRGDPEQDRPDGTGRRRQDDRHRKRVAAQTIWSSDWVPASVLLQASMTANRVTPSTTRPMPISVALRSSAAVSGARAATALSRARPCCCFTYRAEMHGRLHRHDAVAIGGEQLMVLRGAGRPMRRSARNGTGGRDCAEENRAGGDPAGVAWPPPSAASPARAVHDHAPDTSRPRWHSAGRSRSGGR